MRNWKQPPEKFATPLMLLNPDIAAQKAKDLRKALHNTEIFYAVKSSMDSKLIKSIKPHVDGFDVASLGEIEGLISLGIKPDRMFFSNPVKIPEHVKRAYKLGINKFAYDSIDEIEKIAENAPGSEVYLRILVPDKGSTFPLSSKFGVDHVYSLAYASSAIEKGLDFIGLTFHVGSQSARDESWDHALGIMSSTIKRLKKAGIQVKFLDIGGGFPVDYKSSAVPTLAQFSLVINKAIAKHIPSDIRIVAEPGRFISAESAVIFTKVIGTEHRGGGTNWLYLDVSTFHGLMEPLQVSGWKYPVVNISRKSSPSRSFVLTGPTCDASDTIGSNYILPADTRIGDTLRIDCAGAYTLVYASTFNGFSPPQVKYVKG